MLGTYTGFRLLGNDIRNVLIFQIRFTGGATRDVFNVIIFFIVITDRDVRVSLLRLFIDSCVS